MGVSINSGAVSRGLRACGHGTCVAAGCAGRLYLPPSNACTADSELTLEHHELLLVCGLVALRHRQCVRRLAAVVRVRLLWRRRV